MARYIGEIIPCDPSQQGKETTKIITSDTGEQYTFCNLVGKVIYAGEDTQIYENPASKTSYATVKKGNPIGRLYSFIDYGTYMFLTFETTPGMLGRIVFLKPKTILDKGLKTQKVLTVQEQQNQYDEAVADENTPWYQDLANTLGDGLKWGAIAAVGIWILQNNKNKQVSGTRKRKKR